MFDIRSDLQRWHGISFSGEGEIPEIRVLIWHECLDDVAKLLTMHRGIQDLKEVWKFGSFEPNFQKGFGFDGAFREAFEEKGYTVLSAPLSNKVLHTAVSVTFLLEILSNLPYTFSSVLNEGASADDFPKDPHRNQLMQLVGFLRRDMTMAAAPLGGAALPIFVDWVQKKIQEQHTHLPEVEEAMWLAWNAMSAKEFKVEKGKGPHPHFHFRARLGEENGAFFLETLGNACDVSTTDWWHRREGEGHDLDCHNLDSPIQQMSLLAGLAKMHDLASADLDPRPPE